MKWIVGIDEVGRGPLAGPVYVCAVAISEKEYKKVSWSVTDSKKMTAKAREAWYVQACQMKKEGKVRFALAKRTAQAIDKKGISVCIRECIAECLQKLDIPSKDVTVLLDGGLKAPAQYKKQQTIIKGDAKEKIISLASVIAKVQRDHVMVALHKKHPLYSWHLNKGYGTQAHISALKHNGPSSFHRTTFIKKILFISSTK